MPMEVKNLKRMNAGTHKGIITEAKIQDVDFKQGNGPEPSLVVVIQPAQPKDGIYSPVSANFSPSVNPLSGFGEMLKRINRAPDFATAKVFDESSIIGTEVVFDVKIVDNFPRVIKESIHV